jgi:hypothetical protein
MQKEFYPNPDGSNRIPGENDSRTNRNARYILLFFKKEKTNSYEKDQRNTATAMVVVQRPFLSPSADWQVFVVLMILPLAL